MRSFSGRVAAITGAGSGIGRALALALADRGCHLALSDVAETGLAETAQQAARPGLRVTTRRVDVAQREEVIAWADTVVREHGGCNLIFNNAGVALAATAEGTSPRDFAWIVDINFWGVVHGTQIFLPHLRASGDGHIINISSVFGLVGVPGQSAYNATKFAVRGYTEALRQELEIEGAAVSATCVHPGGIKTNIARAARVDQSLSALVSDPQGSIDRAARLFRVSPADAATAILRGVERDARRVLIGADARVIDLVQRLLPTAYQRLSTLLFRRANR